MTQVQVHAVGAVILARRDGVPSVVLIRRGRPPMEGAWTLPGGKIEEGEPVTDAVAREALEETGLVVAVGALVETVEIDAPGVRYVIHDHACRVTGGALRAGDDAAEARWVPVDDVSALGVTDAVLRIVRAARAPSP